MAAVEAARATMEQMVRNAPVSLVMTDRDLRVLEVSGRWSEFYGRPAEEARGQTMHDLFPDGRAEWGPIYRQGLEGVHGRGEQASSASGETRWFQWEVAPWRDAAGDVAGLLLMNIDVSETVRARKLAERAREAADAANRAKSEFLANMSHEVRTPLNGVLGMAGALAHSGLAPLQNEMVELIQSSASTLERMLMDMLELSRLESGPLQTVLEPLDLGGLARDAAQAAAPAARAKGLTFELHIDGGSDLVLGDGRRMRQVLDALLDNAIKFTDRGAVRLELRIEPVRGGARAVFRVSDTGVGFAPADKSRLFDVFEQADGSSTRRFGGSGLGLALCRSIARSLGGSLDAESTPSEGSTFTFSVECAAEPDALLDQNAA
jgi:PAS domain S-box-containing protein